MNDRANTSPRSSPGKAGNTDQHDVNPHGEVCCVNLTCWFEFPHMITRNEV